MLSLSTARAGLAIVCAGLLTFVVTYALLEAVWTHVAAEPANVNAAPTPVVAPAPDSLAPQIAAGDVGVGLPTAGADALLRDVRAGDRLNVLASVTGGDGRPVTAVVVSGAKVLQPAGGDSPLVVEVSAADGLALAHLVLSGTHLSYAVVPAGATPASSAAMDAAQARARLGLGGAAATPAPTAPATTVATSAPTAAPTPQPAPAQPQSQPTATPGPSGGYTVQPGDTLESIAAHLDVDPGALWWANRAVLDAGPLAGPLEPGMQLAIPSVRGFLYQVQPGDSWDSIGGTFNLPGTIVRALNQPSGSDPPAPGSLVFIPQP